MPAMLDDPTAPAIYRTSGAPPYPTPTSPYIPPQINPRQVTLRDRITIASLIPFSTHSAVPPRLLAYLCNQLNLEIEKGDTYPMTNEMPVSTFGTYWFQNFGAVMLLGEVLDVEEVARMEEKGAKWEEVCLGSFYIKPNYTGRSSHVCNGGFLVTEAARNRGVGRLMGEGYLEWAPKLGYTYSVFNLVYETNVASCRIWDALGFKRVGRIKGCGNLRSHPNEYVDALIYGRDLGPEGEDFVSEERFDKIRYYLKHSKYPNGADRAEKSRLRSAATHYKLIPAEDGGADGNERLMLKDKEVVSDPQRQYEIARGVHAEQHGGINKTTATIAEKYHWVRIKETVSLVIKNCPDCKDSAAKAPIVRPLSNNAGQESTLGGLGSSGQPRKATSAQEASNTIIEQLMNFDSDPPSADTSRHGSIPKSPDIHSQHLAPVANMRPLPDYTGIPLDPQIMESEQGQQEFDSVRQVPDYGRNHVGDDGDGHFDAAMDHTHDGEDGLQSHHADTRMATHRHVRDGDDPMSWRDSHGVHEGHGGELEEHHDGIAELGEHFGMEVTER